MAEEKHHHHLFHHKKDEEKPVDAVAYSETTYGSDGMGGYSETTTVAAAAVDEHDYAKEEKQHKTREHLSELGALAAGAFALHESHKAKKDPENAHKHKIEEGVAAAVALGAGGYAFHEHHEKKEAKEEGKHHNY